VTEPKPWMSLPDEEPPERGLAELMAAARMKAEVMANPRRGAWRRLFDVLRRPPVLALATIVVLLGGVIVVGKHPDRIVAPSDQPVATPPGAPEIRSESKANDVAPPAVPPSVPATVPPPRVTAPKHLSKSPPVMQAAPELDSAFEGADEAAVQAPGQKGAVEKGAAQKVVADPLARCRAAANRKDCAGAKACAHEVEKADPSYYRANATQDAALKSCL